MRCAAGRKINRYYGRQISVGINKTEMHVFTDASGQAYSAVCYFRAWRDEDDKYEVILGKTHVSYPNRQFKHVVSGISPGSCPNLPSAPNKRSSSPIGPRVESIILLIKGV